MAKPPPRDVEIFVEALRLKLEHRAAYLVAACGTDHALRRNVEELLRAEEQMGTFLEAPNDETEAGNLAAAVSDLLGRRVGRYRLVEKLGEGGCGVVYLAEQDEPVRRQVALKIIKPGMDTREVIARFEAERQAMALMDHPGIAKIFDAGETESGRPYFVMELVRGRKITDYCNEHSLSTEERLQLFVRVCQAIQHAHQKGVIHRDIKPSNILVASTADGNLQPVIIDFGIAKATANVRLTDKTLFTAISMLVGTPSYMSPEQAAASDKDVDTRSDIYSLGVLLYEMLTGTTPVDAGELLQLGIDEVRRAIREREPLRPSARLSRFSRETLVTIARQRGMECPALIRCVRGDLDWIVMKALEKEPARRYASASGLGEDVQRYLVNETITARPASSLYRLGKAIRRNKLAFGALAVVLLVLISGLITVMLALERETLARHEQERALRRAELAKASEQRQLVAAKAEATKSNQVTKFLRELLLGASPNVAQGRDTTVLRQVLEKNKDRIASELKAQPKIRGELYQTIGRIYEEIGLVPQAIESYQLSISAFGEDPGTESSPAAMSMGMLSYAFVRMRNLDEGERVARESLRIIQRIHGAGSSEEATALFYLGRALVARNDDKNLDELETILRGVLATTEKTRPRDDPAVVTAMFSVALLLGQQDDRLAEAEGLVRDAYERVLRNQGPKAVNVPEYAMMLGHRLRQQAKLTAAAESFHQAMTVTQQLVEASDPKLASVFHGIASVQLAQGRLDEAESNLQQALAFRPRLAGTSRETLLLSVYGDLFKIRAARGDWPAAETMAAEGFALAQKLNSREYPDTSLALGRVAGARLARGDTDDAEQMFAEWATPEFLAKPGSAHFLRERANYRARQGRWSEALADARAATERLPRRPEGYHVLATLLVQQRDLAGSRALTKALIARFARTDTAVTAMRLALDCLVLPPEETDLDALGIWVELAASGGTEGNWKSYAQVTKALFEYRRGHIAAARHWAEQARGSVRPDLQALAGAILALAQLREGDATAARATLAVYASFPEHPTDPVDLGGEWKEWIYADLGLEWKMRVLAGALQGEARALLGEKTAARVQ